MFTAVTKETLYQCCSQVQSYFVYSGNQGNTVSLLFTSAELLCLQRIPRKYCIIAVHKCSAALFTAVIKEILYHCCSQVQRCFVYSGNQGNTVSLLFTSAALLCLQRIPRKHCIIAVHKCRATLFTADTEETLYQCCSQVQSYFVYSGYRGNTVSLLFTSAELLCLQRIPRKHCISAVHKCSATLFTVVTKDTLYHCCSQVQSYFVYSGYRGNTVSLLFTSATLLCLQR